MPTTEKKKLSLFDKIYELTEESLKKMRKPLARKAIKRKIRSGYDDAEAKIDTYNTTIEDEIKKTTDADLNVVIKAKREIKIAKEIQESLAELYFDLFNEEFNPEVE